MPLEPIIPHTRLLEAEKLGLWSDELIIDRFDAIAASSPNHTAVSGHEAATGRETSYTFGELKQLSHRAAFALLELGVEPGDVVAVQLPSWWHYLVLYPACARIGAAINPLMPIFRERELKFMLGFARTKVLVIPQNFRGFDFPKMIAGLRSELPDLAHVLVVDGEDRKTSVEETLLAHPLPEANELEARFRTVRPGANAVTELMYTSGTTGEPKGVMHTANTLLCKAGLAQELFSLTDNDTIYMGSPLAHQTGFMYSCVMTLALGIKSVLQDVWVPEVAARLIQTHNCSITLGATPFLSDLVRLPTARTDRMSSLRLFLCAGAPIPRVLLRKAAELYPQLYVMSAWGMTETGIVTATYPGDPAEKTFETDGRAVPHQQVRVVGDDGATLPAGSALAASFTARARTYLFRWLHEPARRI